MFRLIRKFAVLYAAALTLVTVTLFACAARADQSPLDMNGEKAGDRVTLKQTGIELAWCPPGSFEMGSPKNEKGVDDDETPPTKVELTHGFWIGRTVVTQKQWQVVMRVQPIVGELAREGDDYPTTSVSWEEADEFCRRLTSLERFEGNLPDGWRFVLPTEAQWEYACRAGTRTRFSFGNDDARLWDYAWHSRDKQSFGRDADLDFARPVAQKLPNPWGLYDMHGNVWEWCRNGYSSKLLGGTNPEPAVDPDRPNMAVRGGCFFCLSEGCRSGSRLYFPAGPTAGWEFVGFRVICVSDP